MSFKDEYKEAFDSVVPDKAFLDELSEKMKKEERRKRKRVRNGLVAAASLLVLAVLGLILSHMADIVPEDTEPVRIHTGNTLRKPTEEPNLFGSSKWYKESDGADKIISDFAKRLGSGEELEVLYQNTENYFTDDQILPESETRELSEQMETAEVVTEPAGEMGSQLYYMAQFKNGDIIKFSIYENGYFTFQDYEAIYRISSKDTEE